MTQPVDREVAKIVVGIPGLNAQVPVPRSVFSRIVEIFRRSRSEGLFVMRNGLAFVHVPEDDDGSIDFYLTIVNIGRNTARVEQVHVDGCRASGVSLSVMAPVFRPPDESIPPNGWLELSLRVPIQASAIRQLLRTIQPAQNLRSSPRVQLIAEGTVMVRRSKATIPVRFTASIGTPELNLDCPSAK